MAGSTNYKILLSALISTAGIQGQIDEISKNIKPIKVKTNVDDLKKAKTQTDNVNKATKKVVVTQKKINKEAKSWSTIMGHNISKALEWSIAMGVVYGTINQIKQGMEYIADLNKEMVNIQVVTGMSPDAVGNLASDYNDLASQMGVTTLEVTRGSLEWFRQGKTIEETGKIMEDVLMMGKLGNMESAQSTEYATSILNGFKLEAEDLTLVVDKLIAVDNAAATSVAELSEALSRSSSIAQASGVNFDQLVSYIKITVSLFGDK